MRPPPLRLARAARLFSDAIEPQTSQLRLTASVALRRTLERWPGAYRRWVDWRFDHPNALNGDSELLIDGFPSSANSYVRAWIHFANPGTRIASHQHSRAMVTVAARAGIPVIVPYRDPLGAITSMLTRFPRYRVQPPHGPRNLLRWYVHYHETVLAHADRVVLVAFERATADLTPTVEEVNRRFGTDFVALGEEHWPKVLEYLRSKDAERDDAATRVSAPSEAKEQAKAAYRAALDETSLAEDRSAALAVHAALQRADETGATR